MYMGIGIYIYIIQTPFAFCLHFIMYTTSYQTHSNSWE